MTKSFFFSHWRDSGYGSRDTERSPARTNISRWMLRPPRRAPGLLIYSLQYALGSVACTAPSNDTSK
jgi:hypothetical protein